jgi:hypothetical protein
MKLTKQNINKCIDVVKHSCNSNDPIRYNLNMREVIRLNVYGVMANIIDTHVIFRVQSSMSRKFNMTSNKLTLVMFLVR